MSGPRAKRPFAGASADPTQRHITSFFSLTDNTLTTPPSTRETPSRPTYPDYIQTGLIQVGMRIRKSVEDGYKTGDNHSAFKLFSDAHAPSDFARRSRPGGVSAASQRELLPLCGIHKTGGWSCQPSFSINEESLSPDDLAALPSSQESFPGSSYPLPMSQTANSRKRFLDENDEVDVPVDHHLKARQEWLDGEVSPRTMAPLDWRGQRLMAVPRRRGGKGMVDEQENMAVDDFEDADFLDEDQLNEMQMDA